ncbi:MAG: hypothetical protein DRQ88_00750 [Epsilonproteobacteria bacterium]|nr:MAG: hypothetical protein DRQ89_10285 [Campylobacterota bacterium]RLA68163.1 MAG: hypothetical protein DRQ88_00750 [Campylobacterota bacterium]
MKKLFLILPLATLLFATQGWAPPPGKGGATGFDASKCDLKQKEQSKVTFTDENGKKAHVCTGLAVCAGKTVPVSCKVSERDPCPIAKKCIEFGAMDPPGDGWVQVIDCTPDSDLGHYVLGRVYTFKAEMKKNGKWVPANNIDWDMGSTHKEIWRKPDSIQMKYTKTGGAQVKVWSTITKKSFKCHYYPIK